MSAALGVEGWPEAAARRAVLQEASRRVTASPAGGRVAVRIDPQPPSLLVAMVPCFHAWKAIDSNQNHLLIEKSKNSKKGCSMGLGHAEISAAIGTDKAQLSIAYSEESISCRQSRHYDR
ncbi:uncharacterized protein LOC119286946 isoform X2 [Triticum dicoccoides]|uniref:uncharacterized protein LOC119286946 isoform X2 n=1 Tax=Triticum dicoccoides TaxID=85692 RepID=UPI0018906652|nr:uncharacterized protein LOC119286946 isoform X2 [Triticum dicoccoides]